MKQLITKSDGTPMKSKISAIQFLKKKGIDKELLIEKDGQFFYEDAEVITSPDLSSKGEEGITQNIEEVKELTSHSNLLPQGATEQLKPVNWETPVYDKDNEKTVLVIPGTNIKATINAKHPGGQLRPTSAFEINIGQENFIMSLDLVSKLFRVAAAGAVRTAQSGERG